MNLFLKIKAWQLCCLMMLPIFIIMIWVIVNERTGKLIYIPLLVQGLGIIFPIEICLCWFWALGTNLNKKVPEEIRMKSKFFRFGIIYSVICFFCYAIYGGLVFGKLLWIVLPLVCFAMVCMLYACYFISINFFIVEKKQKKGFLECIKLFMFLWLFYFGVWDIQPKINKIFKEETGV